MTAQNFTHFMQLYTENQINQKEHQSSVFTGGVE
jgi:hypothetical protein